MSQPLAKYKEVLSLFEVWLGWGGNAGNGCVEFGTADVAALPVPRPPVVPAPVFTLDPLAEPVPVGRLGVGLQRDHHCQAL